MKNRSFGFWALPLALAVFGASTVKADDFALDGLTAAGISAAGTVPGADKTPPAAAEAPQAPKDWTVMVFMSAKNNLSSAELQRDAKDLLEMKQIGATGKVNIVVEHGAAGRSVRRLLIGGKTGGGPAGETVYAEYPGADMGDYKQVADFVQWARKTFPARKYMLVLWGHGSGWIDRSNDEIFGAPVKKGRGIFNDEEQQHYIRTSELREMMRLAGHVDILMMNACLMQMAEVLYEMKDYAGLIAGSEASLTVTGFDYEALLDFMNKNPSFTDEQFGDFITGWFRGFYSDSRVMDGQVFPLGVMPATLSVVRPSAFSELPARLDAFTGAVMRNNESAAVITAIDKVIRFDDPRGDAITGSPYADLYDFVRLVGGAAGSPETRQAAGQLMDFIKNRLVLNSIGLHSLHYTNKYDYSQVGGLSINATRRPAWAVDLKSEYTKYGDLALSKDSQWDEFTAWTDGVRHGADRR
ncbi:MAG: clostripain-related cysteine peptidase [Elusimicrobiales bacterium]|jgi:hypothetical protein